MCWLMVFLQLCIVGHFGIFPIFLNISSCTSLQNKGSPAILFSPFFRSSHPDRESFRKYLILFFKSNLFIIFHKGSFVPRTDKNFPGGSIFSSNRHEFSRRVYLFLCSSTVREYSKLRDHPLNKGLP